MVERHFDKNFSTDPLSGEIFTKRTISQNSDTLAIMENASFFHLPEGYVLNKKRNIESFDSSKNYRSVIYDSSLSYKIIPRHFFEIYSHPRNWPDFRSVEPVQWILDISPANSSIIDSRVTTIANTAFKKLVFAIHDPKLFPAVVFGEFRPGIVTVEVLISIPDYIVVSYKIKKVVYYISNNEGTFKIDVKGNKSPVFGLGNYIPDSTISVFEMYYRNGNEGTLPLYINYRLNDHFRLRGSGKVITQKLSMDIYVYNIRKTNRLKEKIFPDRKTTLLEKQHDASFWKTFSPPDQIAVQLFLQSLN